MCVTSRVYIPFTLPSHTSLEITLVRPAASLLVTTAPGEHNIA